MRRNIWDFIFLLVMTMAVPIATMACPTHIVEEVTRCMRPVQGGAPGGVAMLVSGIDKVKRLCRDGSIQEAFSCLNRIYTSCAERREDLERYEMMVGVGKWRRAVTNICDSLDYMADNAGCEREVEKEFRPCANRAVYTFKRERRELQERALEAKFQNKALNKAIMEAGCSLTTDILECLQVPYRAYCPPRMANLVIDAFQDFIPPACVKRVLRNIAKHDPSYAGGEGEGEEEGAEEEEEAEIEEGEGEERENGENEEGEWQRSEERPRWQPPSWTPEPDRGFQRPSGVVKDLIHSYNVPLVFPKPVTKAVPVDSELSDGRQHGRSRNHETEVQISHASDVARSRNDGGRQRIDGEGGGEGGASCHSNAPPTLLLMTLLLSLVFLARSWVTL